MKHALPVSLTPRKKRSHILDLGEFVHNQMLHGNEEAADIVKKVAGCFVYMYTYTGAHLPACEYSHNESSGFLAMN